MGRILAIDYGRKRVGLAVTDPLQMIAHSLLTVPTHDIINFLSNYLKKENVDFFVVGNPKTLNNSDSESQIYLKPFLEKLKNTFPEKEIILVDERFTSKIAFQSLIDSGLKKKDRKDKSLVDTVSATIILQSYLESKSGM